jgi:hypothetical protein
MKSLSQAVYRISPPGGVFDESVVRNLFPGRSRGAQELLLDRAVRAGEVLRLKRGLFILAPEYRKKELHPFALASLLQAPSHVSLESALSYHALIPEAVYQVSSVSTRRRKAFTTPLGVFVFYCVPAVQPRAGVEAVKLGDISWAYVATPLRAIADMVYLNREIVWGKNGMRYLLESLRIEREELQALRFDRCDEIIAGFRSRRVKAFLNGLRKELGS